MRQRRTTGLRTWWYWRLLTLEEEGKKGDVGAGDGGAGAAAHARAQCVYGWQEYTWGSIDDSAGPAPLLFFLCSVYYLLSNL